MPVRGLGAKNVVFSGMRIPAAAAARAIHDRRDLRAVDPSSVRKDLEAQGVRTR